MGGHVVPGKGLNVRGYAEKLLRLLQCCPVFLTVWSQPGRCSGAQQG